MAAALDELVRQAREERAFAKKYISDGLNPMTEWLRLSAGKQQDRVQIWFGVSNHHMLALPKQTATVRLWLLWDEQYRNYVFVTNQFLSSSKEGDAAIRRANRHVKSWDFSVMDELRATARDSRVPIYSSVDDVIALVADRRVSRDASVTVANLDTLLKEELSVVKRRKRTDQKNKTQKKNKARQQRREERDVEVGADEDEVVEVPPVAQ